MKTEIKLLNNINPEFFRDEVLDCIISESIVIDGESGEDKFKSAEKYLRGTFREAGGNYMSPSYRKILAVMKILLANEYRAGKDSKTVTKNFMKISNRIKAACS